MIHENWQILKTHYWKKKEQRNDYVNSSGWAYGSVCLQFADIAFETNLSSHPNKGPHFYKNKANLPPPEPQL